MMVPMSKEASTKYRQLVLDLRVRPHLKIYDGLDVHTMLNELQHVNNEWIPYETNSQDPVIRTMHFGVWSGRTLLNYTRNSREGVRHYTPEEMKALGPKLLITDLGRLMPTTLRAAQIVGGNTARVRLMRIAPGKQIVWHSHVKTPRFAQAEDVLTCHIPIKVPQEFRYRVTHEKFYRPMPNGLFGEVTNDAIIYEDRYEPGGAYVFNSYHPHQVVNPSTEERVSVMVYLPLKHPTVFKLVSDAVQKYNGPLIEN